MKNCCVVITTHKEKLGENEEKSFLRALEVFKGKDIKLIIPNNISTEYFNTFKNEKKIPNRKYIFNVIS